MPTIAERRRLFRELHRAGCFAIPNPWDAGTARYLQQLGFKAIATTSAGYAFSRGVPDGSVQRDDMLAHIKELVEATDLPVSADFENGYATEPEDVAENVRLCVATGVAGLSIEDAIDHGQGQLYDLDLAVERIRAAREAIAESDVILVGRAEGILMGRESFDRVLERLCAYANAGADCLYAPGVCDAHQIKRIVAAVAPKPVNLLIGGAMGLTMKDAQALGVRRVSVGGALARTAWAGFIRAAKELAKHGTFNSFAGAIPHAELQALFANRPWRS
jgi:2-methylisocitrate lyase-like PEP mutase family enzyme